MTKVLNKYKVLLDSGKWNAVYPEQKQIVVLTTVMEKLKYDKLNKSKSIKTAPKNKKGKVNNSQSVFFNVKLNTKVKK